MAKATVIESPHTLVLFSYSTPVAYFDKLNLKAYKTTEKHSRTTQRHLTTFFREYIIDKKLMSAFNTISISQEELNEKFPLSITTF